MSDIMIKLPKETLREILKQIPFDELGAVTRDLRAQTPPCSSRWSRPAPERTYSLVRTHRSSPDRQLTLDQPLPRGLIRLSLRRLIARN